MRKTQAFSEIIFECHWSELVAVNVSRLLSECSAQTACKNGACGRVVVRVWEGKFVPEGSTTYEIGCMGEVHWTGQCERECACECKCEDGHE